MIPENEGFDLECHKTSGTFYTDFDLTSSFNAGEKKDIIAKYKEGGSKFTLKLTSGDIYLNKM